MGLPGAWFTRPYHSPIHSQDLYFNGRKAKDLHFFAHPMRSFTNPGPYFHGITVIPSV